MSSYLTFYLVPKKTTKKYSFDGSQNTEEEIKLSEGKPLSFLTYSRSSDIYQAFNENLNVVYIGNDDEPKYEELTLDKIDYVISEQEDDIKKTEQRLETDYKMLKNGAAIDDMWEDIHSMEDYLREQREVLQEIKYIKFWVTECIEGYNQFEKVLMNID